MTGRVAFVFPGQGSQAVGMGKSFYTSSPRVVELFQIASDLLKLDLAKLCFEGPIERLTQTDITQPAILTVSLAAALLLEERGIVPAVTAGHSLGEYAAHTVAKTFSAETAIHLTHLRGKFMAEAAAERLGTMAAILLLSPEKVAELIAPLAQQGVLNIANINAPGQIVISGETTLVQETVALTKPAGGKGIPLTVGGAFHSELMRPAALKLADVVNQAEMLTPQLPVFANVTAAPVQSVQEVRQLLIDQVCSPVRWVETIQQMIQAGTTLFVEVGPGKVLSGLIKKIDRSVAVMSLEDMASLEKLVESIDAAEK